MLVAVRRGYVADVGPERVGKRRVLDRGSEAVGQGGILNLHAGACGLRGSDRAKLLCERFFLLLNSSAFAPGLFELERLKCVLRLAEMLQPHSELVEVLVCLYDRADEFAGRKLSLVRSGAHIE